MKKVLVTATAAALACAGYSSTFFDTYSTYPSSTYNASYDTFTMTAGTAYANEMTLTALGPIISVNFELENTTSSPINLTTTNPLYLIFYNNNAGNVGGFITGYSLSFSGSLAANTIYGV
ncbi:MAG TPA: hypothetical protein VKT78_05450, partial [Fimbriimonadaceae bacterium]|nr:hypothetical protein [Fimbriimonadaceae bacterium]